jgi:hypothetical protein
MGTSTKVGRKWKTLLGNGLRLQCALLDLTAIATDGNRLNQQGKRKENHHLILNGDIAKAYGASIYMSVCCTLQKYVMLVK